MLGGVFISYDTYILNPTLYINSVLVHLLPGLALAARHHLRCGRRLLPLTTAGIFGGGGGASAGCAADHEPLEPLPGGTWDHALWLLLVPLAFYAAWQVIYWLVVQVAFRRFILQHNYDTSYSELGRRAAKSKHWANGFVRRGPPARRVLAYGLLQAAFTAVALLAAALTYTSPAAAAAWQLLKFGFPLFHGAAFACEKAPRHAFVKGLDRWRAAQQQQLLLTLLQSAAAADASSDR